MNKKSTINLILSAFLVTAFVICTYFFSTIGLTGNAQKLCNILITVVFGLVLFYATRVGEGKAQMRFSIATLLIMDLPAIYIILTSIAPGLPLADYLGSSDMVVLLAGISLGYGIPYTFLSGFELNEEFEDSEETDEDDESDEVKTENTDDFSDNKIDLTKEENSETELNSTDGEEDDDENDNEPDVEINV